MYLIQEASINTSLFNFNVSDVQHIAVTLDTTVPQFMPRLNSLIGTLTFNYYITDNLTAASLNMQIATVRFNAKLQTFN